MTLLIFDLDGVLVDSEAILVDNEMASLREAGLDYERVPYLRRFLGMPTSTWEAQVHADARERLGRPLPDGFFDRLHARSVERMRAELVAVEGARAAVEALDHARCVASSSLSASIHRKLTMTGMIDLFDPHLFSTEAVEHGKPAPDLFLHAAARMETPPERCIVIEDSANGVIAAKRAGMTVIGFIGGGHCPDAHGETLREEGADLVIDGHADLPVAIAELLDA